MYISKLEIKNYRNFKDFEINLKPLTLIIGENNIGKSNLLDSIGLIFNQEVSTYKKRMLEVSDFNYDVIYNLKKDILNSGKSIDEIEYPKIKIIVTLNDWDLNQESVIGDWYSNDELTEAKLTYLFSPISSFDKTEEIQGQRDFINNYKTEIGEEKFAELLEHELLDLINFPISKYYYTIIGGNQNDTLANLHHLNQLKFELLYALRDAKSELTASHNNRLLFRVLNAKEENEYQDLKKQLIGLQTAIKDNQAIQSIRTGISTQLNKISLSTENTNNVVDLIFSIPNVEDLLKKLSLIYGENPVKIERNGTGRNNLLFISLILSFIEDPTKAQSNFFRIVGIEEPESHLHANLQNHLAQNIESLIKLEGSTEYRKDIQLILTSHSNHITTKIDFDNTVVLYNKNGVLSTHRVLDGFTGSAEDIKRVKYLRKYLDTENINLFYSKKIVLVEGISEKLLFPVLYKIETTETIEKSSCCIVNVNGLAFKNFLDIIKNGYHTKCLVLTDSDKDTKAADRAENLANTYSTVNEISVNISEESTFEKDIITYNSSGQGKVILIKVLKAVRPIAGLAYANQIEENDINTENYFQLIEEFKSDFAYQLMIELDINDEGFTIPNYIKTGITFLTQEMATKPILVIAGPGAGKTYGMVNEIISSIKELSPARYMIVITYTNSATNNIKERLSKRIQIPPNLFVGTIHSFLNKFIVIPFSSFHNNEVNGEKLFIQCQTTDIFEKFKKDKKLTYKSPKDSAIVKSRIKTAMNKNGYITYDQTVALAKQCLENKKIKKIISNRIQYLFVDEFQDTGNNIFYIIDALRKEKTTNIYCVGDPEQYIQSFDSTIKNFTNIPILKTANSNTYELKINYSNFRSTETIISFLNNFNGRVFGEDIFAQNSQENKGGESVKFIEKHAEVSNILPLFYEECDKLEIQNNQRCVLAKRNEVINRIAAAINNNYISPKKSNNASPIKEIMATLLSTLDLSQSEYYKKYNTTIFELRKNCILILKAIKSGEIDNENTFYNFVKEKLKLEVKTVVPVKLGNLRINSSIRTKEDAIVISNIHSFKGLESEAVLAIAKSEAELLLWIELNHDIRDAKRTNETTDYPRLGYVAFSRAKQLLCIACIEKISEETKNKLIALNVEFIKPE